MNLIRNEKGVALITVLLFGLVAFGVVMGTYFMVTSGSGMSGMNKRYISELDVAKGVSDYTIGELVRSTLRCNGTNCTGDNDLSNGCAAASTIDIPAAVCTALGKQLNAPGCNALTACFISESNITEIDATGNPVNITLVSINVNSVKPSGEQANIDFVLRLE